MGLESSFFEGVVVVVVVVVVGVQEERVEALHLQLLLREPVPQEEEGPPASSRGLSPRVLS